MADRGARRPGSDCSARSKSTAYSETARQNYVKDDLFDEAIERLSDRPDATLALLDLQMPGMESAASLRAVRECFPQVCLAVVSASNRREDMLLALEAGVHGYVPKGQGPMELARSLQFILDGNVCVPASITKLPVGPAEPETALRAASAAQLTAQDSLTPRQRGILELLIQGKSNKQIARALDPGEGTVKVHMAALFRSLGVNSRSAAAVLGSRLSDPGKGN